MSDPPAEDFQGRNYGRDLLPCGGRVHAQTDAGGIYRREGPGAGNARKYLEEHPEIVRGLKRYWAGVERVLAMNILFVPVDEAIVKAAHPIRQQNGLLNNDSLIVACMKHLGLTSIATNDDGFLAVSGLSVFKPADL